VRIRRAPLATPEECRAWQSEIGQHFEQEIQYHFAAEEKHLFPAARVHAELVPWVEELLGEHARLRQDFTKAASSTLNREQLRSFAETLSTHIRKEERQLFEGMQKLMSPEELQKLGMLIDEALAAVPEACIVPTEEILKKP
jgi:hemerythrin-like domain-containing protein